MIMLHTLKNPLLETALQIRRASKIIDDEKAIANLETTRNLFTGNFK